MATLLVVDDDPDVSALVALTLRRAGHVVRAFDDPVAALEDSRTSPAPDLAVLDVDMPRLDGPALLAELRRAEPGLPALFVTAHADGDRIAAACGAGRVAKPFLPAGLARAVDAALAALADPPAGGRPAEPAP